MAGARRHEPGGIAGLLELLEEHAEAVDADLQAHYGLGLAQAGTAALSLRRLAALLRRLPTSSALARDTLGEAALWSLDTHLLAVVVDALAVANWQRGGKGRRPRPIHRPGVDEPGTRYGGGAPIDQDKARAYLDSLKPPLPDGKEVNGGR